MDPAGGRFHLDVRSGTEHLRDHPFSESAAMNFVPRDPHGSETLDDGRVMRPAQCPECRSKSIGTLAKIITADTYWRCQACGTVWNEARRTNAARRRW
jgi:predicted Zn finger-like uncharacterized protein